MKNHWIFKVNEFQTPNVRQETSSEELLSNQCIRLYQENLPEVLPLGFRNRHGVLMILEEIPLSWSNMVIRATGDLRFLGE